MKKLEEATLILCSIVRNAERGLKNNIPVINSLCKQCKDYRIVVYENDSMDHTKSILREWSSRDKERIHVLLNDTDSSSTIPSAKEVKGNPFFCKERIYKMAQLRNQYMDYIEEKKWEADYLIVVDLDVAQLNLKSILTSFSPEHKWDAVTAFGYSTSPRLKRRYHDTYALTEYKDENSPQTESKIKKLSDEYGKYCTGQPDKWIRVFSAFGGLAIYRFEAIKGLRYHALKNQDKRVEVYCEHYSIYQQMNKRNYDLVYINPAMSLKYQSLTWNIVWKHLLRKIHALIDIKQ